MWTLTRSSLIWVHTVCKNDLKSQADDKADDTCCDWQFEGKCCKDFALMYFERQWNRQTRTLLAVLSGWKPPVEVLDTWPQLAKRKFDLDWWVVDSD